MICQGSPVQDLRRFAISWRRSAKKLIAPLQFDLAPLEMHQLRPSMQPAMKQRLLVDAEQRHHLIKGAGGGHVMLWVTGPRLIGGCFGVALAVDR